MLRKQIELYPKSIKIKSTIVERDDWRSAIPALISTSMLERMVFVLAKKECNASTLNEG